MQTYTYKYGFWRVFSEYTPKAQAELRRLLASNWGVSNSRVTQIVNSEKGGEACMTSDQLVIAAKILNCELIHILEPCELIDEVQV